MLEEEVAGMQFVESYKGYAIYKRSKTFLVMIIYDFVQKQFTSVEECKAYINLYAKMP